MATTKEIANFQRRSEGKISYPVPALVIPELPDKIARIDPAGAKAWHREASKNLDDWVKKQNVVSTDISTAIKT